MGWIRYTDLAAGPNTEWRPCEVCCGGGRSGVHDISPTDRAWLQTSPGDMAYRGYTPTTGVCEACDGQGGSYWPKEGA
jgi:hypothetical protein